MGDGTASRERSAVQKSANALQRPSWDLIPEFALGIPEIIGGRVKRVKK
jgi:hypothetical protein